MQSEKAGKKNKKKEKLNKNRVSHIFFLFPAKYREWLVEVIKVIRSERVADCIRVDDRTANEVKSFD